MNTLLLLLFMMVLQESPGFSYPEFDMECYPKTVMPGDTLNIKIIAKNLHAEPIYVFDDFRPISSDIQTHLRDSKNQAYPLLFESRTNRVSSRGLRYVELKPGDSRIIGALAINVPPLEDLKESFWERHLKNLSIREVKFSLCVTIISSFSVDGRYSHAAIAIYT